jgi:hypothetical protein
MAISLPLRNVNSSSESESARAFLEDIETFWQEMLHCIRQLQTAFDNGLSTQWGQALDFSSDERKKQLHTEFSAC